MTKKKKAPIVEVREVAILSAAPQAATLGEVLPGYVNHIGGCIDGAGNVFAAATQDGPNAGDVDLVIMKRAVTTGAWSEVFRFSEAIYNKHGYGDLVVLFDGRLCCLLSERRADGAVVFKEYLLGGLAVAPGTGGGAGVDQALRNALAALPK